MESRGSKNHSGGTANDLPPEQTVIPKPMSVQNKYGLNSTVCTLCWIIEKLNFSSYRMRLMIIRIGDEKRQLIDDHIRKVKDTIVSDDV